MQEVYLKTERFQTFVCGTRPKGRGMASLITATILVAAPFERGAREHTKFFLSESLSLLEKQGGRIFLYHSTDDPVVPFSELAKYQAALPHATTRIFEDRQHFNQETFPELVADIKSL